MTADTDNPTIAVRTCCLNPDSAFPTTHAPEDFRAKDLDVEAFEPPWGNGPPGKGEREG